MTGRGRLQEYVQGGAESPLEPQPLQLPPKNTKYHYYRVILYTRKWASGYLHGFTSSTKKWEWYRVTLEGWDYRDDCTRGGRPTTSISSPNHILIIFSSEPHRNPRPFNIIFLSVRSLKINTFFKNMATLGHKTWLE